MNWVTGVLNRVLVLHVVMEDTLVVRMDACEYKRKKGGYVITKSQENIEPDKYFKKKYPFPVFLFFEGKGIVRKRCTAGSEFRERIIHNKELLWEERPGEEGETELIFMRRESLSVLEETFQRLKIEVFAYRLGAPDENIAPEEIVNFISRWTADFLNWRKVFTSRDKGVELADLLFNRLLLPTTLVLFGILCLCQYVNGRMKERIREKQTVFNEKRQSEEKRKEAQERTLHIFSRFSEPSPLCFSEWSARIAAGVPEKVRLLSLQLFPGKEPLGQEVLPQVKSGIIYLKGECCEPQPVMEFNNYLSAFLPVRQVRLISLSSSEEGKFVFETEMIL